VISLKIANNDNRIRQTIPGGSPAHLDFVIN
jgi:hypothetical protein